MARWKLMTPHYLHTVDPIEWEYSETNRSTGRPMRTKFKVPRFIDPRDPQDWTSSWRRGNRQNGDDGEGECVVCFPGRGEQGDIEFLGDPTPDMMPLDDEAKKISASFEDQWAFKPETSDTSFSQSLVDAFQAKIADAQAEQAPVRVEGLDALVAAMAKQTELIAAVLGAQAAAKPETRRV